MSLPPRKQLLLALLGVTWVLALIVSFVGVPWVIETAFDGESIDFLNRKFEGHRRYRETQQLDATREWYLNWGQSYAIKAAALSTAGAGIAALLLAVPSASRRVRRFLFASSAPFNLAVLRVVTFGMLFYLLSTERILEFAAWSQDLYQWPALGGIVLSKLPISVEVAGPVLVVGLIACGMAIVGLFSRTSALVSVVLAFYLLGIPQSSGKVNHMHHVLLVGAVLALSRCGDALSFDSIRLAIRRADQGEVGAPRRAVRYGLPIRLAMVIMAMVYFFPGFWKIASNGPAWIFSDNLHNQLLVKWFQLEEYTPALPIHELPYASQMGALTAVVFELGFPLALLWTRSRALWAVLGITFHNLTRILMNISFMTLQAMYVMFVDWQRLLAGIGRRCYGNQMVVLYDNHCKLCRRTVSILDSLDWLSVVQPVSAFDRAKIESIGLGHLEDDALMQDMHAGWQDSNGEWHIAKGYAAYQALAWRVPKLWGLLPLVYLAPVVAVGKRIYRRVADSRACQVVDKPPTTTGSQPGGSWSPKPLIVVAAAILLVNGALGVARIRMAWPLACYPLFDQLAEPTILWPEFAMVTASGETIALDDDPLRHRLGDARYVETLGRFLEKPDQQKVEQLLQGLVGYWHDAGAFDGQLPDVVTVSSATYELTGVRRPEKPASSELLYEVPWSKIETGVAATRKVP